MANTGTDTINTIVENLLHVIPIVHKRLMKVDPPEINCGIRLSRLHIGIMAKLSKQTQPISEIAREFLIPKPQMTYLIDQLCEAGMVERRPNPNDRRITDLILTPKGKEIFRRYDEHLRDNVRAQLSHLTEKDLEDFSSTLLKLKEIGTKLENRAG